MKKGVTVLVSSLLALLVTLAFAQSLQQILKVGGAIAVADRLGPQINSTINKATGQANISAAGATKVVPVLSVGEGKAIGIVQVAGPKAAVDQTQAVAQVETGVPLIGGSRAKAMLPINTRSVTNMRRVNNVGVSAIIDLPL